MNPLFERNRHLDHFLFSMGRTPKGVGADDAVRVKIVTPEACNDLFRSLVLLIVADVVAEVPYLDD